MKMKAPRNGVHLTTPGGSAFSLQPFEEGDVPKIFMHAATLAGCKPTTEAETPAEQEAPAEQETAVVGPPRPRGKNGR